MYEVQFSLDLSAAEYLAYYQGTARNVIAHAIDGRTVQFPANILRGFVTHDGIHGLFAMRFDTNNKFVDMRRLGV